MLKTNSLPVLLAMAIAVPAYAQNQPGQTQQQDNQPQQQQLNQQQQPNQPQQQLNQQQQQRLNQQRQRTQQQRQQADPNRDANQAQAGKRLETHIAKSLQITNQQEIELAKMAAERAQSDKVKEFAKKLVSDHEAFGQKLSQIAGETSTDSRGVTRTRTQREDANGNLVQQAIENERQELREQREDARTGDAERENVRDARQDLRQTRQDARQNRRDANQGEDSDRIEYRAGYRGDSLSAQILEIQKDASQECMSMVKELMQSKQGADFDKAFLSQQVGMHIAMLSAMKASEGHVSGELQQVLQDGQKTVSEHKDRARELMKSEGESQED